MNNTLKRVTILLSIALAFAALVTPSFAEPKSSAVLTLMVYVTGSDLESSSGAATGDITEMMRSGVDTEKVNIILCTGGAKRWQGGFPNDHVCFYQVEGRRPRQLESLDLISMGEASTLSAFLNYSYEHFPADQYALILWDHGGGPMNGVCFDELFLKDKTHDSLDLSELRTALTDSPFSSENPLEWIGFDACLMSSVETAYICSPFAKYMIASQETEPGTGWDYSFLNRASEGLHGEEMGRLIVESYTDDSHASDLMLTLSCIDLSQLENVEKAMNDLFGNLDNMLSPDHFSEISNGRRDAKSFGRASTGSEYDLVDLFSLAEQYAAVQADRAVELQTALEKAVIIHAGNQENSHGLSVYYPYYNKDYYKALWSQQYGVWGFAEEYSSFMDHYADMWLGEQLADWSDVKAMALEPLTESQEITLSLNQDQISDYAFAQVYVIGKMSVSSPYYFKIDEIDDVTLDEAGVLHAEYNYKALYVVDENNNPLCDAVPYRIVDGYYLIRANLTDKTWNMYWDEALSTRDLSVNDDATINARKVYLMCLPNETGDGLNIVGIIDMRDEFGEGMHGLLSEGEGLFTGKQSISIDMKEWNWVWFFHFPREQQYDSEGNLLSFEEWVNPNVDGKLTIEWEEIDNTKPWQLKFLEQQYTGQDLYAQYIIHDTQGNLMGSDLITVANPNLIHARVYDETVHSSSMFTLSAEQLDLAKAEFNDGLFLHFDLTDHREESSEVVIRLENIVLNRCMLSESYRLNPVPEQDGHTGYVLNIPTKDIPDYLEETLDSIRFDVCIYDPSSIGNLDEFSVALDSDVDISPIHNCTQDKHIIAETQVGDIKYQLIGIEENDDCITLTVIIDNMGQERVEKSLSDSAVINGCEWPISVESAYFDIAENSWKVEDVQIYKLSPSDESIDNRYNIPQYSYAEYWGINSINSFEFTDWNDELIRFKLEEPFHLKQTNDAADNAGENNNTIQGIGLEDEKGDSKPEGKERTTRLLLKTNDIEVNLTGMSVQDSSLRFIVDIANISTRSMKVLPQFSAVNGNQCNCSLGSLDSWFSVSLSPEELPAGREKRLAYTIKIGEIGDIVQTIESVAIGFEYLPDGVPIWQYCSPAILTFEGSPTVGEISNGNFGFDRVTVKNESYLMENKPVDPPSLIDVTWEIPNEPSEYQTNLCTRLTDAQIESFVSAKVMLMMPWVDPRENESAEQEDTGLSFITALSGAELLDGNKLICPFNGILIGAKGVDMPLAQFYKQTGNAYSYDAKAVKFYTDHADFMENDAWLDELTVTIDLGERSAIIENASLSRSVGCSETMTTLECWTSLYAYTNGIGSTLEKTGTLVGDDCELNDSIIHLVIRPAGDYDPIVVFVIRNKDGNEYTIQTTYQKALSLGMEK